MKSNSPRQSRKSSKQSEPRQKPAASASFATMAIVVAIVTFISFLPALWNEFIDWDDFKTLVENTHYRGLGWTQIRWMFSTFHMGHYQPLSWLTFAFDYLIWGAGPFGYHFTNLLIHVANAVIFFSVARRLLSLSLPNDTNRVDSITFVAALAAVFFAVHPLRVESVAWATERRDVLSGFFFLLTILCYLHANRNHAAPLSRRRWLGATALAFVLSLLSKASAIVLPAVLLLLDVYPMRRLNVEREKLFGSDNRKVLSEKIPFLFVAVVFALIAIHAQQGSTALKSLSHYGLLNRLAQAAYGIVFYIWKTILPLQLSPLYEIPPNFNPWDTIYVASGVMVITVWVGLLFFRQHIPAVLACWLYYIIVLSPVLGITQSGPQLVADRYSYLSCLSWALLLGGGMLFVAKTFDRAKFALGWSGAVASGLTIALSFSTWNQTKIWHDSETLWRYAVHVSGDSSTAHYNLGFRLHKSGNLEEAVLHYRKSLQLNPTASDAHYYLGDALAQRGELDAAVGHYEQALQSKPSLWGAHHNLGIVYEMQGRFERAIDHYRQALIVNPEAVESHHNLGILLVSQGKIAEALDHFLLALRTNPNQSRIHFDLANVLLQQGDRRNASAHLREAVRINPNFAEAHYNLATLLAAEGRLEDAVFHFRSAVKARNDFPEALLGLAQVLWEQGNLDAAKTYYQEANRIFALRKRAQSSPKIELPMR
jgi:protein O-mannosyl-transferase